MRDDFRSRIQLLSPERSPDTTTGFFLTGQGRRRPPSSPAVRAAPAPVPSHPDPMPR
ncbi:hypothetical protein DAI18_02015 [Microvirgula aerodenitrificans]|uniref:Uncharacterized protein n=1 Tax=Microvirgula aerodenitrificans TaxID=57480 RepID=A0A2S0PEY5_9NEIS|nr:hypothetical protein DAI18_02015 [Microvirgula aerodenitrificans]